MCQNNRGTELSDMREAQKKIDINHTCKTVVRLAL